MMQYLEIDPITTIVFNSNFYVLNPDGSKFVPVLAIAKSKKIAQDFIDEGYNGGIEGKTVVQFKSKEKVVNDACHNPAINT